MKIALVTDKFSTGGGLEHIYQLCCGMPDVEFGVFAKDGNAKDKFILLDNVTVFDNGYASEAIIAYAPDVVHFHHLKPLLAFRGKARRSIFTVHGIHLHQYEFKSGLLSRIQYFIRLNLEKFLYRKVDRIISVSYEDENFIAEKYGVKAKTVFNGIQFDAIEGIQGSQDSYRMLLDLPADKRIYLTVARFDFPKGYDVLIKAIGFLKQQDKLTNHLFVFAGDGAELVPMQELVAALKIDAHVRFLGRRTDVYELMKAADVFVLPSRWEGLPITLIESLVSHLPVIASDTYGIKTVYNEIKNNISLFENENSSDLARVILEELTYESCDMSIFSVTPMISAMQKEYADV